MTLFLGFFFFEISFSSRRARLKLPAISGQGWACGGGLDSGDAKICGGYSSFIGPFESYELCFGYGPLTVTVGNEGL